MSTRATIACKQEDGRYAAIYLHFDGFQDHAGRVLKEHYTLIESARTLVAGGDRQVTPLVKSLRKIGKIYSTSIRRTGAKLYRRVIAISNDSETRSKIGRVGQSVCHHLPINSIRREPIPCFIVLIRQSLGEKNMTTESNDKEGTPRGIPLYIDTKPRKVSDPSIPEHVDGWQGSNDATFKLLEGLESLRDLKLILSDLVAQERPHADLRRIKRISTPLYSLAWSVINICDELINNPSSYGGRTDACEKSVRLWKQEMERVVPLSGSSVLRKVRNKIDAHIDSVAVMNPEAVWEHVSLENFAPWLGCTIAAYKHLLGLDIYAWSCESHDPNIWRLMSADSMLVDFFMQDGQPSYIVSTTQTISPKVDIAGELNEVITLYNSMLDKLPEDFFSHSDSI